MASVLCSLALALAGGVELARAQSIHDINGMQFLSPYRGQAVTGVTGIVVGKTASGLYLRSPTLSEDARVGNGLYVYSSTLGGNASIAAGDTLTLDGTVTEYRSSTAYLYSTELTSPVVRAWTTGTGAPTARVIGTDTGLPPTQQYTGLDGGDVFGTPNNASQVSTANPTLQPDRYGLDYWKTLQGELVTVTRPVAVSKANSYGEVWMAGATWPTSSRNGRGGLTQSAADGNPEALVVGAPLDGSDAAVAASSYVIGDAFEDITGVVHYEYGFYALRPLTAVSLAADTPAPSPALPPPTALTGSGTCDGLTVADYNVENMAADDAAHIAAVAAHIADYLRTPDVLLLQEIQDNDGATNDGVVDASETLSALVDAIAARPASGGLRYAYAVVDPENDADGGEPGGNIRVAYLYNPAVVQLRPGAPAGGALDADAVLASTAAADAGLPTLRYNPGRIDPANAVWDSSRKPLAAEWQTVVGGHVFFTVNVHWTAKGGSSSLEGDLRPPVNSGVAKRELQANVTAAFVAALLARDSDARVLVGGDMNEFAVVAPVQQFAAASGLVDLADAAAVPALERYTYSYGSSMEALDHLFVSPAVVAAAPALEHVHVNTWVSADDQVSDHDPTVAQINVCGRHVVPVVAASSAASVSVPASVPVSSAASVVVSSVPSAPVSSVSSASPTSTAAVPVATAVPSGKGHVDVVSSGVSNARGLITAGVWYRGGGSLATYTATPSTDDGGLTLTLATSKGPCAILADTSLSCASSVTEPSLFGYDGTYLTYAGANVFYADSVPSGTDKATIYTSAKDVTLQLAWEAL